MSDELPDQRPEVVRARTGSLDLPNTYTRSSMESGTVGVSHDVPVTDATDVDPRMAMALLAAQEQERSRLAEELHDGPAQALANAIFQTEIVERAIRDDPERGDARSCSRCVRCSSASSTRCAATSTSCGRRWARRTVSTMRCVTAPMPAEPARPASRSKCASMRPTTSCTRPRARSCCASPRKRCATSPSTPARRARGSSLISARQGADTGGQSTGCSR